MKEVIYSDKVPKPIGPYSQAIKKNGFLFISGQIAINPESGKLIEGDVSEQTKQIFLNLKEILSATQLDFNNIVKVTVYLTNISEFSIVNQIYSKIFTSSFPAREIAEVKALPLGAMIEISVIAAV